MFFSIPNTVSSVVTPIEKPWEYNTTSVPDSIKSSQSKIEYRQWCNNPATAHCFISGNEGLDPNLRVSWENGNPPLKCHAIIVDYDASNTLDEVALAELRSGKRKWPSEYPPNYIGDSFTQGHLRVIWLLESPVLIISDKHYKKFMQIIDKKIRFNKWFSGFEADALGDSVKYYMVGNNYRPVRPESLIPKSHLDLWSFEAAKMVSDTLVDVKYSIPLEKIAEEVHRKFPGRWNGAFEVGSRGVRFWDATAKDPTGAQVLEHGMMAYSGEQAFLPWVKIFGMAFVEKFEADKIAGVLDSIVCQSGNKASYWYHMKDPDRWVNLNQGQMTMRLQCLGFSSSVPRNATASEITRILDQVHLSKQVHATKPLIYFPKGIITVDNKQILNTSDVSPLTPAPSGLFSSLKEARTYFPTIWAFLSGFFEKTSSDPRSINIQLEFFLSWLAHAYSLAVHQTPQPGLILILAGPPSAGKSFVLHNVISKLLGGAHDIKDILSTGGNMYTDLMCTSPVGFIDDQASTTNTDEHKRYSERIKALVSNHKMTYNGKWKETSDVWWFGRIVICMNDDASSIRMMPDLSLSMAGKVAMLMINRNRDDGYRFSGNWKETEEKFKRELPFFARYLLDFWRPPDYLVNHNNPRYYLVPYKHPELYQEAQERGVKHELYELLHEFVSDNKKASGEDYEGWTGTTTDLFASLSCGKYDMIMRKWTTARLGTALGLLSAGTNIKRVKGSRNMTLWHIPPDFDYLTPEEFGEKVHTEADEKKRLKEMQKIQKQQESGDEQSAHNLFPNLILPVALSASENTELSALTEALRDSSKEGSV